MEEGSGNMGNPEVDRNGATFLDCHSQNNDNNGDTMLSLTDPSSDNSGKVVARFSVNDDSSTLQKNAQRAAQARHSRCDSGCEHTGTDSLNDTAAPVANSCEGNLKDHPNKRKLDQCDKNNAKEDKVAKKKTHTIESCEPVEPSGSQKLDECIQQIALHTGNFCRKHDSPEATEYFVQLLANFLASKNEEPPTSAKPRDLNTSRAMNYLLSVLMGEVTVCKDVVAVLNPDFVRITSNNLTRLIRNEVNHRLQAEISKASGNRGSHVAAFQIDNIKKQMFAHIQQKFRVDDVTDEQKLKMDELAKTAVASMVRQAEQSYEIQQLERRIAQQQEEYRAQYENEFLSVMNARKSNSAQLRRLRTKKAEILKAIWKKESVIQLLNNELVKLLAIKGQLSNDRIKRPADWQAKEIELIRKDIEKLKGEMESLHRHRKMLVHYQSATAHCLTTLTRSINNEESSTDDVRSECNENNAF